MLVVADVSVVKLCEVKVQVTADQILSYQISSRVKKVSYWSQDSNEILYHTAGFFRMD